MTQTYKTPNPIEKNISIERQMTPNEWSEAAKTVRQFSSEPAFLEMLQTERISPTDPTTVEYANALSVYAQDYCDVYGQDGTVEQSELEQVRLIANAPYFLHVKKEVSFYEHKRSTQGLNKDEREYYQGFKPYMVWYNQALSDYAYSNPNEKMSDLNKALIEQSLVAFPRETGVVEREIKMATRGGRTEAVARSLIDLTSIDYAPGTIEDDLKGGDFIVMHNGNRVKVDIKSSLSSIAHIRGGYDQIEKQQITYAISKDKRSSDKSQHTVVLFPGFTDSDIGDSLSLNLSQPDIQKRADFVAKQLNLAFAELRV